MSWTVACFCGHLFCGPASRCPRCDMPVPVELVGPYPDRGDLEALIRIRARARAAVMTTLPLGDRAIPTDPLGEPGADGG